jgi:hypothetical protein
MRREREYRTGWLTVERLDARNAGVKNSEREGIHIHVGGRERGSDVSVGGEEWGETTAPWRPCTTQ